MKHINILLFIMLFAFGIQAQQTYVATLSGEQQVPPIESEASGTVTVLLEDSTITVTGSFKGLESDFNASIAGGAHLHIAYAGSNGAVSVPIDATVDSTLRSGVFEADSNRYELDADQLAALQERRMYVNIHTIDIPSGELRGQVLPAAQSHYFLNLSGEAEVPPINTPANGALAVEIYENSFVVTGSFADLVGDLDTSIAGGAHLHRGDAGENGPVVFPINASPDSGFNSGVFAASDNDIALTEEQKTIFALGGYYANIHTDSFPSGELRGQVDAITSQRYLANLTGRQEALPVATLGKGEVNLELIGDRLVVSGSYEGMSSPLNTAIAGGAHLHVGYAGQNGPVTIPLNVSFGFNPDIGLFQPDSNIYVLDSSQMAALQQRRLYVNIHSMQYPAGELRGQVLPEANEHYFINLLGSNEVPPVMTHASGAVAVEAYDNEIVVTGTFRGLESDFATDIAGGAHIHRGMAGENGPVIIPINATEGADNRSGTFTANNNTFSVSGEQLTRLDNRGYYVNIHSDNRPAGELRGQVAGAATQIALRSFLSGASEVPSLISSGHGQIIAELSDSTLMVYGRFDDLEDPVATSIAGGLHIHAGLAGQNGPVQFPLDAELDMDSLGGRLAASQNIYDLSGVQVLAAGFRGLYVNVHSTEHEGGEIRGQLLPESQIIFDGQLSGIFGVPNALTGGYGGLKAEMNGSRLIVSGSFQNLSTPVDTSIAGGAHLHLGLAGSTGPINFALSPSFPADTLGSGLFIPFRNRFNLDSAQITHLRARHYYANIHTEQYPAGELRAQLLPESNYYMVASLAGTEQVLPQGVERAMPINTDGTGMVILEVTGNRVIATGSFGDLSSPVDTNIAGGAHLHTAFAGQNGPIAFNLNSMLRDGGTSGRFEARNNINQFTSGQLDTLRERMFYVNVHSENFAPGEIRGQVLGLARAYFTANLSGINEVQPVSSSGNGTLLGEFTGLQFKVTGSFAELGSKLNEDIAGGAHLHIGGPDENGGVSLVLNTDVDTDSLGGVYRISDNTFDPNAWPIVNLFSGNVYANIHSDDYPGGEVRGQLLDVINFFPMDVPSINSPMDGDSIILEGDASTVATIDWQNTAVDENDIVYIWEAAIDSSFNTIVVQLNVGELTEINFTYGQLDTLLMSLGVAEGETANIHHRVLASDGSVVTPGEGSLASITRNLRTSVSDIFKNNSSFSVYPTVTTDQIRISGELPEAANSEIHIRNAMGQLVDRIPATNQGMSFEDQYTFNGQPQGMYILQWIIKGETITTKRVLLK